MPAGLQVFKADGNLQVDTSTILYKEITIQSATSASGSYTVPTGYSNAVAATPTIDATTQNLNVYVDDGTKVVSWNYGGSGTRNGNVKVALL